MEFETLATGYGLVEGPRVDEQNRLYFSDARGGGVFRRSSDGKIETLISERKMVGGIGLLEGGGGLIVTGVTVVRWDEKKTLDRVNRLQTIAREAAEVSFRTRLPEFAVTSGLAAVLRMEPDAVVLSEVEGISPRLVRTSTAMTIVVGPEGGWSKLELRLIASRGITLGPRVLRVDHAGPAAAAILLLQ